MNFNKGMSQFLVASIVSGISMGLFSVESLAQAASANVLARKDTVAKPAKGASAIVSEPKVVLAEDSIYQVSSKWVDQNGKPFLFSELVGRPVALSMIYMSCTYVCPATVAHMKDLDRLLGDKAQVQFVLVSFDPDRDTPEVMKKYADKQKLEYPKWRFVTSKKEADIREISALIDFRYKKLEDGEFDHSFGIVALDAQGRIKGTSIGTKMKPAELVEFYK